MFGEVHWSEESEAHIARHGIDPDEVEEALYGKPRWTRPGRGDTTEIYGITNAGRHLLIIISEGADGRDWVVTAREMTATERRTFRKKGQ